MGLFATWPRKRRLLLNPQRRLLCLTRLKQHPSQSRSKTAVPLNKPKIKHKRPRKMFFVVSMTNDTARSALLYTSDDPKFFIFHALLNAHHVVRHTGQSLINTRL